MTYRLTPVGSIEGVAAILGGMHIQVIANYAIGEVPDSPIRSRVARIVGLGSVCRCARIPADSCTIAGKAKRGPSTALVTMVYGLDAVPLVMLRSSSTRALAKVVPLSDVSQDMLP